MRYSLLLFSALCILLVQNLNAQTALAPGTITTVAGSSVITAGGFAGDGGPATSALLSFSKAVALDAAGNLYIADSGNNRIRRVGLDGIITTVVGDAQSGFSGDGGAAINASLFDPRGLAVDGAGNLYFADAGNERIRKVSPSGLISTMAGRGLGRPGDSFGDGGLAINALLRNPTDVALDGAGNLNIADYAEIRKVDSVGIITTVAGHSEGGFSGDGGSAINAEMENIRGVAFD